MNVVVVRQPQRGCLVVRVRHIFFGLSGRGFEGGFLGLGVVSMVCQGNCMLGCLCWSVGGLDEALGGMDIYLWCGW